MRIRNEENGFLIRLDMGEPLLDSIICFAKERSIEAAFLWGLGAVKDVTLGYYDIENKRYEKNRYDGTLELVSLTGNLARTDEGAFVHAHAVISNSANETIGGHVFSMVTAATVEIYLIPLKPGLSRKHDERTGLKLLDI
ncbi:MAG: DNA-binding protein [Deltaproteobacteria bacterium]|uniref:DNA-binding protein n=1 Tax=Candidatus Zymogenus saltonus TaxID=2844893 RepID=A0A9D8PS01_9DELT|nr:DNA-binding protein [Candidatus Zymogenus saltonus]